MKKRLIVHPVLFAILPILFLYSHNIRQLSPGELLIPTVVAAVVSLLLWLLLGRILRDRAHAGLVVSFFWLWFFSYGHLLAVITKAPAIGVLISERYTLTTLYCVLLFACVVVLIQYGQKWRTASPVLSMVAVTLAAWQVATVGHYEVRRLRAERRLPEMPEVAAGEVESTQGRPNIYFIVLDGYARADVLKDLYHYDNSGFLDYLEKKGFSVARNGMANYSQTLLSLASCLNLDYLDELAEELGRDSGYRRPLEMMVAYSKVGDFLKKRGYRTVAFASGYEGTEVRNADIYLGQVDGLSRFQSVLLNTTPLPSAFVSLRLFGLDEADMHRRRVLYTFERLADTVHRRPPLFVFAHIVSPHPPFLFDRHGEAVQLTGPYDLGDGVQVAGSRERYVAKYREQLVFVNHQIMRTLDRLLETARYPTVIILQADHGPGSRWGEAGREKTAQRERLAILNAYYFPSGDARVPDDMSPVNAFRMVLNRHFGANLPLLPNESYFSPWSFPYRFTRVTDAVNRNDTKNAGPP